MIVGVLQVELAIPWATSLKDKRRVVKSLKDRLHREHMVSVAEVAQQENPVIAILGIACVGADGQRIGQTLDRISDKIRATPDAELSSTTRELLHGVTSPDLPPRDADTQTLADEMLARISETDS